MLVLTVGVSVSCLFPYCRDYNQLQWLVSVMSSVVSLFITVFVHVCRRATSMELPMAMRFRKLQEHAKEAVGVYRSAGIISSSWPDSCFYISVLISFRDDLYAEIWNTQHPKHEIISHLSSLVTILTSYYTVR